MQGLIFIDTKEDELYDTGVFNILLPGLIQIIRVESYGTYMYIYCRMVVRTAVLIHKI